MKRNIIGLVFCCSFKIFGADMAKLRVKKELGPHVSAMIRSLQGASDNMGVRVDRGNSRENGNIVAPAAPRVLEPENAVPAPLSPRRVLQEAMEHKGAKATIFSAIRGNEVNVACRYTDQVNDIEQGTGETPLTLLASFNNSIEIGRVVQWGGALNGVNAQRKTALEVAAHCGFAECVQVLLGAKSFIKAIGQPSACGKNRVALGWEALQRNLPQSLGGVTQHTDRANQIAVKHFLDARDKYVALSPEAKVSREQDMVALRLNLKHRKLTLAAFRKHRQKQCDEILGQVVWGSSQALGL